MHPAGTKAFESRDVRKTNRYSFERENAELEPAMLAKFRANRKAWRYFEAQPPYYRKMAAWFVMSARQEATRARRLAVLIADSAAGRRIGSLGSGTREQQP